MSPQSNNIRNDRLRQWGLLVLTVMWSMSFFNSSATAAPLSMATRSATLLIVPAMVQQVDEQTSAKSESQTATNDSDAKSKEESLVAADHKASKTIDANKSEELPDWVDRGSYLDKGAEYLVVSSDEQGQYSLHEAKNELWVNIIDEVNKRIDQSIQPGASQFVKVDESYVRDALIVPRHEFEQIIFEPVPQGFESEVESGMIRSFRCHAQLKLDNNFYDWANHTFETELVKSRVLQSALIGIGVIVGLGLVFSYFQLDHRTRGFYRGRLQTIALASLLILVAAAAALSNSFDWL